MTTHSVETPYFPLIIESEREILGDMLHDYAKQVEPQLLAVIEKSKNEKAVAYARQLLAEIRKQK